MESVRNAPQFTERIARKFRHVCGIFLTANCVPFGVSVDERGAFLLASSHPMIVTNVYLYPALHGMVLHGQSFPVNRTCGPTTWNAYVIVWFEGVREYLPSNSNYSPLPPRHRFRQQRSLSEHFWELLTLDSYSCIICVPDHEKYSPITFHYFSKLF